MGVVIAKCVGAEEGEALFDGGVGGEEEKVGQVQQQQQKQVQQQQV
jgi:hypothetical protein